MANDDIYDEFSRFGEVRKPQEAESPILGPVTRQALHQWMYELNYATELSKVGVKPRRRAILKGPPGTGKTTLAWHVAGRLGLALVVVETPSLISKYIGQSGEQIGALFRAARRHGTKVALFFDELDAIAGARGGQDSAASKEKNSVVIALLQMMDRHPGLLFAATNRPDDIDPAIWRRFQLQIEVGLPGDDERFAIVRRYIAPFITPDDTVGTIADALQGASPALMREVVEALKRDLVLGPRLTQPMDAGAMFRRIKASIAPAATVATPYLWHEDHEDDAMERLSGMAWPPTLEAA